MKYILIISLLGAVISCGQKKHEEAVPEQACPLLYEFDKLVVDFQFAGPVPADPKLYLNELEIGECYPGEKEFCIYGMKTEATSISYRITARAKVLPDLKIDLMDGAALRISRTDEALVRSRTRPNDPCGSGFVSNVTVSE